MPSVVHVVVTGNFAGVERYVANTSAELARRGWEVSVVGGELPHMAVAAGGDVAWLPGATPLEAARSLARVGRRDVCHVHMTLAEAVGICTRVLHRAPVVSTRHFAAHRGSTVVARRLSPLLGRLLSRQIAVSNHVARSMERRPDAVIANGVPASPLLWSPSNRVVLVLQRLEREKDTLTALRAWKDSKLCEEGWSLRVVGDGSERRMLQEWVEQEGVRGVTFAGWVADVAGELARAAVLLAPAPTDSVGLSVLEALAAGVPVVACGGGGHLETVGRLPEARLFAPGDSREAAAALRSFLPEASRAEASSAGRALVASEFSMARHVDRLLDEYARVTARSTEPKTGSCVEPA